MEMQTLVEFRKKHKLTQQMTWQMLGISRATLQRWEKLVDLPEYIDLALKTLDKELREKKEAQNDK